MSTEEFVYMFHPEIDALGGPVTRKAFDEVHAPKGWRYFDHRGAATLESVIDEAANWNMLDEDQRERLREVAREYLRQSETKNP